VNGAEEREMPKVSKEESGWVVALSWVGALEEAARDFHGTRPRAFCQRAYEHAVQNFLRRLELYFDIRAARAGSILEAIEEYIRAGVLGGAFADASLFELSEANPNRVEVTVHHCLYLRSCEALLAGGVSVRDLTCARLGCFRAAVRHLADIDCDYEVTAFALEDACTGAIERS
jgi:hypothetical protein